MKRFILIAAGMMTLLGFSSCLKDTPYLTVSNTEPIIEFGQSIASGIVNPNNGYYGAFPFAGDTLNGPVSSYDTAVALVLASPQVLNDTVVVTIALDTTQLSAYNTAEGDSLTLLPDSLYTMPQMQITIAPGYRVGNIPVNLQLASFPAHHNYGLPIMIISAVDTKNPGDEIIVSGNAGKFMWLFER